MKDFCSSSNVLVLSGWAFFGHAFFVTVQSFCVRLNLHWDSTDFVVDVVNLPETACDLIDPDWFHRTFFSIPTLLVMSRLYVNFSKMLPLIKKQRERERERK